MEDKISKSLLCREFNKVLSSATKLFTLFNESHMNYESGAQLLSGVNEQNMIFHVMSYMENLIKE